MRGYWGRGRWWLGGDARPRERGAPAVQHTTSLQLPKPATQTALMNSPLRLHLVNHNLRYIDWPHGYGDPSAYWRSVGQRHASGPMVLTEDLAGPVLGSPAMFARKLDLEMPEGVDFMQRWDKWMSHKLQTGTDRDAVQVSLGGSAGGGCLARRAPSIARAWLCAV